MVVAPSGRDRVAISNHRQQVLVVDLAAGKVVEVERSAHDRIGGLSWSPDGRWLAYGINLDRASASLHLHDSQTKKTHEITRPEFRDFSPSFDPGGKYLYFLSSRVFDPVYDNQYFDLGFPRGVIPCLIPLAKDTPSPFAAATQPPRTPGAQGEDDAKKQTPKTVIDLKGIADRVVAFPVPEARYWAIEAGHERAYFVHDPIPGSLSSAGWRTGGAPPAKSILQVYDFEKQKTETVSDGMSDFSLSMDRKTMLLRVGNRLRAAPAPANGKALPALDTVGR